MRRIRRGRFYPPDLCQRTRGQCVSLADVVADANENENETADADENVTADTNSNADDTLNDIPQHEPHHDHEHDRGQQLYPLYQSQSQQSQR